VIGFHGVWREIRRVARRERVIGRRDADRRYLQQVGGNVVFAKPTIAYYSAPAPFAQDVLYPVYVYSGTKVIDGDSIPLPNIMVPATRSGDSPASTATTPSTKRMKDERPRPGSTDPEHSEEARIGSFSSKPGFEVAASWIGTSDGLLNAEANVTGLLDALVADDWVVNFNWGDADALHSDWNVNRDQWADATDLIFYTGHAKLDSWKLVSAVQNIPDVLLFQKLTYMDAASYPFGAQDLEWILIAACGPLQDRTINPSPNNDENAIERWRGAFDGLHILLGYGSVSFDYGEEGRRFATHALEGQTIIDSWFRAAAETQPPTNGRPEPNGPNVYAGAMWAEDSAATSPVNDHLWGHGSVAPDPKSPIRFKIMWVPT
jgi:hypothetical protein